MASKRTKTTASEFSVTIPTEMITEILYRVPAKSIGRFRCVSKDWLSELTSPQFIENHRNTLNQNHLIFVSWGDRSLNLVPLDHHHGKEPTKCNLNERFSTLFGSCNGLVLVSFRVKGCTLPDGGYLFKLLVLNPITITMEFIELPDCGGYKLINKIRKHNVCYGFGYDSLTDEYKLVTIHWRHDLSTDSMRFRVFNLTSNNTYTRVTDYPKDYSYIIHSTGVFVNGFLHWFAKKRSDGLGVILAFNLASENCNVVPSPDVDIVANRQCKLVGIGGKLAIVVRGKGQVWLMNEYGVKESWTNILIDGQHEFCTLLRPMFSVNKGYILGGPKFPVNRIKQTLIDDETKTRYYSENADFCQNLLLISQDSFTESLVSPNISRIN